VNESKVGTDLAAVAAPWKMMRQGDIIEVPEILKVTSLDRISGADAGAVVVISQTCDIVLDSRPNIAVARLVRLTGDLEREALAGMQPRYVHLPNSPDASHFVDLEYMTTISKEAVGGTRRIASGVNPDDDMQVRQFGLRVARRFGRFPFPDEVAPWLEPLKKVVKDKHDKPTSSLGQAFRSIVELRVESSNWRSMPMDLTLHVIVKAGTLPEVDFGGGGESDPKLVAWLDPGGDRVRTPAEIVERLFPNGTLNESPSALDRQALWMAFAEALANQCRPKGRYQNDDAVAGAVRSVVGLVVSDDEFTLVQYRNSEMLDLDHLSLPTPLGGSKVFTE
jgi:hypothetical protein